MDIVNDAPATVDVQIALLDAVFELFRCKFRSVVSGPHSSSIFIGVSTWISTVI